MKRTTLVILIMLVAAGMFRFAGAAPAPFSTAPAQRNAATSDYCAEPEELAFLKLINEYRAQNGLLPLALSQTIGAAAEHHSTDMARNNYFSHQLSNGISWSQNMTDHGYTYNTYRGENIAAGNELASNTYLQWKNSPTHDANMLSTTFYAIGIGRAYDANSTWKWYWTTNFGGKVDGPAVACGAQAPAATNTPRPTATKTPTPTKTATPRPTNTTQPTATKTPTNSPTPTATSTPKPTKTATPTATRTLEPTATRTPRPTETPLPTSTVTSEPEQPRTDSARATRTARPTQTPEPTRTPRPTETPRPTRTPQPANTPFVDDSSTGSVSVSRVRATSSTRRGETTITIDITLRASDRGSVEGAVISVKVTDPSGKSTYLTGSTNRRGQVTIKMKTKSGAGTYSVAVADVQAPDRDYNSAENRATTDTVRVR